MKRSISCERLTRSGSRVRLTPPAALRHAVAALALLALLGLVAPKGGCRGESKDAASGRATRDPATAPQRTIDTGAQHPGVATAAAASVPQGTAGSAASPAQPKTDAASPRPSERPEAGAERAAEATAASGAVPVPASGAPPAQESDGAEAEPSSTSTVAIEAPGADDAEAPGSPASLLARISLIGASVTAGFGASIDVEGDVEGDGGSRRLPVNLGHVLAQSLASAAPPDLVAGTMFFFMDPRGNGTRFARTALSRQPSLLIALDFLFWFGYGVMPENDEAQRMALLEEGLALLDPFTCPIVVGDFPDMSEAVGRMLSASQMPRAETLEALNARLRAWAAERENVILFPLARLVQSLRSGEAIRIGENEWPARAPMLQPDRLHPTAEGMIALAQQIVEELLASRLDLDPALFVRDASTVRAGIAAEARQRRATRGN
ncbi:MAG TPA: hypothetical protein PKC43_13890 [Phycisphaerales bacterium]|nr:hypothetical protein [Phycisphaerales bacterium]HMP38525.1 hypothetical protein [Phycisphaerales bacterium]